MLGLKRDMFDCMEALGLAPRPLYDVSGQGSCMLAKATPYFSGLDPFAWAGTSSIQCEYSVCECECVFLSEPCCVIMQFYLLEESDSFQFYVPILALHSVCLCA